MSCTPPMFLCGGVRHECTLKLQLKQHNTRSLGWLAGRAGDGGSNRPCTFESGAAQPLLPRRGDTHVIP
eukprot:COSAG01_NODE_6683_length_3545_cov_2.152351_4_plen_69_part_00